MSAAEIVTTGAGPSTAVRGMREPVTDDLFQNGPRRGGYILRMGPVAAAASPIPEPNTAQPDRCDRHSLL